MVLVFVFQLAGSSMYSLLLLAKSVNIAAEFVIFRPITITNHFESFKFCIDGAFKFIPYKVTFTISITLCITTITIAVTYPIMGSYIVPPDWVW